MLDPMWNVTEAGQEAGGMILYHGCKASQVLRVLSGA